MDINNTDYLKSCVNLSDIVRPYVKLIKKGNEWVGLCPFHQEKTPSFNVNDSKGLYLCRGCSASGDVYNWMEKMEGKSFSDAIITLKRMAGNISSPISPTVETKKLTALMPVPDDAPEVIFPSGKPDLIHTYRNEEGKVMFHIGRYEAKGEKKKWFAPLCFSTNGKWETRNILPSSNRPLYGLHKINRPHEAILMVCGEKKCDQLQEFLSNYITMTWMGGDGVLKYTDLSPLSNKTIIFWPDQNPQSIIMQHDLAKVCKELYVIPIPDQKPREWDCGDAIEEGWDKVEFDAFINRKVLYGDLNQSEQPSTKIPPKKSQHGFELPGEMPGLCGEIENYINATSSQKQPFFASQAAIAFVGALKSHRVCTERKGMTNIYCISVGEAGSGKDHARICLETIALYAGIDFIMEPPASGPGLITSLKKRQGRALLQIDEIGRFLTNINHKNSGSHQKEIIDNIMMLYSCAGTIFREKGYAIARQEKSEIVKPCLSIHAMSTPKNFFANLGGETADDGFLSRLLIVTSENRRPDRVKAEYSYENVPKSIIHKVIAINNMDTNVKVEAPAKNENDIKRIMSSINPKTISLSPEAEKILTDYETKSFAISDELYHRQHPLERIWARLAENCQKVALILAEGDSITGEEMQWACKWCAYWTEQTFMQLEERTATNEHEANVKKLLQLIKKTKGITRYELTRKTQWLRDGNHRKEIIQTLLDSEQIEIKEDSTDTKKTRQKFYLL